jgi:hypothetical protein
MCRFLTAFFAMAAAGILQSFDNVIVFVALTDIRLVNIIFQRDHTYYSNFSVNGFDFELTGHEEGLDIYYYTCTHRDFPLPFAFFGINSSTFCGPLSNLNFFHFIWDYSERLAFMKYAMILFPYRHSRPLSYFF